LSRSSYQSNQLNKKILY